MDMLDGMTQNKLQATRFNGQFCVVVCLANEDLSARATPFGSFLLSLRKIQFFEFWCVIRVMQMIDSTILLVQRTDDVCTFGRFDQIGCILQANRGSTRLFGRA